MINTNKNNPLNEDNMNKGMSVARRVPLLIRIPVYLLIIVLAGYWIYSESGPFYYISRLQAFFLRGTYNASLSAVLTFLVPGIPGAILIQVRGRRYYS